MTEPFSVENRLLRTRYTNAQGKIIPLHHAFKVIRFGRGARLATFGLPLIGVALVWLSLGSIITLWDQIMWFWVPRLVEHGTVSHQMVGILGQGLSMPYSDFGAEIPATRAVWINLIATGVLFLLSFILPGRWLPGTYMARFGLIIQASASAFFLLHPQEFPWDLGSYITAMLSLGMYILLMLPIMLGLVFYIFDFPLWWKCLMTILTLCFFAIFLPYQYLAQAWIIHMTSLLFLPLMYFMMGILIDVLMFICFFSIGMSWRDVRRRESDTGRYA